MEFGGVGSMFGWCLEVSAAWSPPSRGLGISTEADLAAKAMAMVETGLLAVLAMLTVWRRFFADHQMSQGGFLVDRDAMVWFHVENLRGVYSGLQEVIGSRRRSSSTQTGEKQAAVK